VRESDGVQSAESCRRVLEPILSTKGDKRTGLGLSMNYGIIQRHGGELTIDTEEGVGTTVTFRLPIARRKPRPAASAWTPVTTPLHVLLVDDDPNVRRVIADVLAEDGHRVTQVADGPRALAL